MPVPQENAGVRHNYEWLPIAEECFLSAVGERLREEGHRMAEEWVKRSREHLRAAELLLSEGLYHLVCFHAQRAAVEVMLAMLEKNGVPAPHSATLLELLSACEACDPEASALRSACAMLDLYGAEPVAEMPGMLPWGPPRHEQAAATLEAARKVVQSLGRLNFRFAVAAVA